MLECKQIYEALLGPAKCAVDLGDGSERGLYVNQDYILHKLGRPHRAINLMFCYYPYDEGWPIRASIAHANKDVSFAWDYPYDDYFPYTGGLNGTKNGDAFTYMKDIRRHGQDVLLTLTVDPHVTDDHLIAIAHDLSTYGHMFLRINHEATGTWFAFNKRCSYQEIADFYVRFHKIIKQYAPNVQTILCIGGVENEDSGKIEKEEEFAEAVRNTDIWSIDQYLALHWGWPYDIASTGGKTHKRYNVQEVLNYTKRSYERFILLNDGIPKPMVMSELNADGDVTGPYDQANMIQQYANIIEQEQKPWLNAFTLYQFRDDGRLGLEITDPNNKDVGIEQPLLKVYKEIIHRDFFSPSIQQNEIIQLPTTLRWGSSEDSQGISIPISFTNNPVFCEAFFEDDLIEANLMLQLNGHWFYKAPGVTYIDLMEAFFETPLSNACTRNLSIFAPPASGENIPGQSADWQTNYYTTIASLPKLRILYNPIES